MIRPTWWQFWYIFVTLGIGSLQTNPAGLTGSLGTAGTASLRNPFGTTTGLGSTSLTSGSTFWTPLRTNTLGATGLGATTGFGTPSLTGGFGTPALGSSTGGAFGSTGTGLGGTGFGTGTSAFTAQPKFQLQRPPAGNKRGKRRWNKQDVCCFKHAIEATCVKHNILDLRTHA